MRSFVLVILPLLTAALDGGQSKQQVVTYSNGYPVAAAASNPLIRSASFEYTGMGASESNIYVEDDGSLVYSPAVTKQGVGYATSTDYGKTWTQVVPGGHDRSQPVLRIIDGRYYFWSFAGAVRFSVSDDKGKTWTTAPENTFDAYTDWLKLVAGKPVTSTLAPGAKHIMYISGPSPISVSLDSESGPTKQLFYKSLDRGTTWQVIPGGINLKPTVEGGAGCPKTPKEYSIFGDGFVRANGTIIYGLRHCQSVGIAISDDEGANWSVTDIPGTSLVPYSLGIGTWAMNGNVLVADPLTEDSQGTMWVIWVDPSYGLNLARSSDGRQWSKPAKIAPPGVTRAYHPKLIHHPTEKGRAAISFYGSADSGVKWQAFVLETRDINAEQPVWESIAINNVPIQENNDKSWDQGYGNLAGDLIEFSDIKYHPNGDLVTAFTAKMCSDLAGEADEFDAKTCKPEWDFEAHENSPWQGFVGFVHH